MLAELIIRRRMEARNDCAAWLVPGLDTAALLDGLARCGLEPLPRVYLTAAGFMVRPDTASAPAMAGAIRLAEIAPGVYAPRDAELVPALLPDEAAGLTSGGAVLCLPGQFLSVDVSRPLKLSELLAPPAVRRREWQPPAAPLPRATEISRFIYDRPENDAENVLDQANQGIGEQEPGPEAPGAAGSMLGKVEFAAGRALAGLGRLFGNKGLEQAGGGLMGKSIENDPRRLEGLLGKQEAALRDLLRRFREGNTEEALRRALPLTSDTGRGARASGSAELPMHSLGYSLGNLLGGRSTGASVWFTERDVYAALITEYRKAAEQARKDGDSRRAAFIYGKLLGDWRTAANLLQQGGLHHDAAQLYLHKLNDPVSAARAYEAAGDIDEAVRLYRKCGQHVPAGDLLRRAGDEPAALAEYEQAARLLADRGECKSAGELLMAKADPRQALPYFERGWRARPHGDAMPCALHLAVVHADAGEAQALLRLTGEADRWLNAPGNDVQAVQFYNMLATLAEREALSQSRAELHDRALIGLAHKLRQRPRTQTPFDGRAWPSALVSDAQFAARLEARQRPAIQGPRETGVVSSVRVATGRVTCACQARTSGELFIGLEDGRIFRFSPTGGTVLVRDSGPAVLGIACSQDGGHVSAMHHAPDDWRDYSCYVRTRAGQYQRGRGNLLLARETSLLCAGEAQGAVMTVLYDGARQSVALRRGEGLEPYVEYNAQPEVRHAALVRTGGVTGLLLLSERAAHWLGAVNALQTVTAWQEAATHWRPMGLLAGTEVSIRQGVPGAIEIAGRNEHGSLYWSNLTAGTFGLRCESRVAAARGDYLCAALIGGGRITGVTPSHVNWFKKEGEGFALKSITQVDAGDAAACFHFAESAELMILSADGRVSMVSVP